MQGSAVRFRVATRHRRVFSASGGDVETAGCLMLPWAVWSRSPGAWCCLGRFGRDRRVLGVDGDRGGLDKRDRREPDGRQSRGRQPRRVCSGRSGSFRSRDPQLVSGSVPRFRVVCRKHVRYPASSCRSRDRQPVGSGWCPGRSASASDSPGSAGDRADSGHSDRAIRNWFRVGSHAFGLYAESMCVIPPVVADRAIGSPVGLPGPGRLTALGVCLVSGPITPGRGRPVRSPRRRRWPESPPTVRWGVRRGHPGRSRSVRTGALRRALAGSRRRQQRRPRWPDPR